MFPGFYQMLIVVAVIFLLFGAKRLPTMMRSIGQSVTEFKKGVNDATDDSGTEPPTGDSPDAPAQ
tara:strand:+ start:406 stop:600 length:195 start_codon:yes stop_codon:yes gene_type:complete